jgi:hypothetical protein
MEHLTAFVLIVIALILLVLVNLHGRRLDQDERDVELLELAALYSLAPNDPVLTPDGPAVFIKYECACARHPLEAWVRFSDGVSRFYRPEDVQRIEQRAWQ